LPAPGASHRLQRHAPILLGAVLVLIMIASLAWQTAGWLRLMRTPPPAPVASASTSLATPALERLEPLFGPVGVDSSAPPPATNLRLTLLGSFVHDDPKRSSAIIQREGSKPQRYAVGAELDNGVRLHAVYRDRVELERQGRLETLPFPSKRAMGYSSSGQDEAYDENTIEQFSELHDEDAALLRERMDALRQQMEAAGSEPTAEPTEPMESE